MKTKTAAQFWEKRWLLEAQKRPQIKAGTAVLLRAHAIGEGVLTGGFRASQTTQDEELESHTSSGRRIYLIYIGRDGMLHKFAGCSSWVKVPKGR